MILIIVFDLIITGHFAPYWLKKRHVRSYVYSLAKQFNKNMQICTDV